MAISVIDNLYLYKATIIGILYIGYIKSQINTADSGELNKDSSIGNLSESYTITAIKKTYMVIAITVQQ